MTGPAIYDLGFMIDDLGKSLRTLRLGVKNKSGETQRSADGEEDSALRAPWWQTRTRLFQKAAGNALPYCILDCFGFLAFGTAGSRWKSARGLAQSKTLREFRDRQWGNDFALRSSSAARFLREVRAGFA